MFSASIRCWCKRGYFPTRVFPALSVAIPYFTAAHLINLPSSLPRPNSASPPVLLHHRHLIICVFILSVEGSSSISCRRKQGYFPTGVFSAISVAASYLSSVHLTNRPSSLPGSNQRQHHNHSGPSSANDRSSYSLWYSVSPSVVGSAQGFPTGVFPLLFQLYYFVFFRRQISFSVFDHVTVCNGCLYVYRAGKSVCCNQVRGTCVRAYAQVYVRTYRPCSCNRHV